MSAHTMHVALAAAMKITMAMAMASTALAAPGAHGPNGEHIDAPAAGVRPAGPSRLPDASVIVPKNAQRRMEIRTVLARQSEAAAIIELPGRMVMDPNASGRVQAAHGGRIEPGPKGLPIAGQSVRRGEVLAYVRHHPDPHALGAQQALLAELRAQRQLAETRVQRLQALEGSVPAKEIEAARTEARSLAERERSISDSLARREALTAPVSGVVARAELAAGQVVEPKDVLVEIVDPARMLVEATTADATLAERVAGASLHGVAEVTLRFVGMSRAMREGVLPISFAVAPTRPGAILPLALGQPVSVLVETRHRIKGIVLPAQAIARNASNEPIVWVKSGTERFIAQPVQFRPLDTAHVVVTQGLGLDNRVVAQGAALISQIR